MSKIIQYDKLFPLFNNTDDIYTKLKIDVESVSYMTSPYYAEKITRIIEKHISSVDIIISDCTAGCGGDTISFLKTFKKVYSIEKNLLRFICLKKNIESYNYQNKANIYCNNFSNVVHDIIDHDVIYIDPPWGGSGYKNHKQLRLNIEPFICTLLNPEKTKKVPKIIVLKLPNNYDLRYLYDSVNNNKKNKIFMYNLKKMFVVVIHSEISDVPILDTSSTS